MQQKYRVFLKDSVKGQLTTLLTLYAMLKYKKQKEQNLNELLQTELWKEENWWFCPLKYDGDGSLTLRKICKELVVKLSLKNATL